jgi:uncharacterized protein (TIGR02246 family)
MLNFVAVALLAVLVTVGSVLTTAQTAVADEAAIKKVVEASARALNKDDLTTVLAQYADDAMIDSRAAGGKVPKQKYAEVMAEVIKKGDLINVELRDVNVKMTDPARATVLGTVYLQTRTSRLSGRNEWKLEMRDGRWLIVETTRK